MAFLGRPVEAEGLLREAIGLYEQPGDVRGRAIALGTAADILEYRGQLDAALRIRLSEALPVYEQLGDIRGRLVCQTNMAPIHLARGAAGDREAAADLLRSAGRDADHLRLPDADKIRELQRNADLEP